MTPALDAPQSDNETDEDLIELMGMKLDFPKEALEAYGKIYERYWKIMYNIALGVTRDEQMAKDLLSDTFNVIYNRASTFKKGKIRNPNNVKLSIQKWMTTIMEHVFYDDFLDEAYKQSSESETLQESYIIEKHNIADRRKTDYDDFIEELEDQEVNDLKNGGVQASEQDSENVLKVRAYIENLSERDRDIVLTTYNFYMPNKYTPTEVLDELEKKWGTTRENIRKILSKFRKSIKEELQAKMLLRK